MLATSLPRHYHGITTSLPRHYHGITTALPRHYHNITTTLPRHYHGITTSSPRHYHNILIVGLHLTLISGESIFMSRGNANKVRDIRKHVCMKSRRRKKQQNKI